MQRILFLLFFGFSLFSFSQEKESNFSYLQANYFYGNILKHNKNVGYFLANHPTGFMLSWNKKTTGKNAWESRFNYPDVGVSFGYQDFSKQNLALHVFGAEVGTSNFTQFARKRSWNNAMVAAISVEKSDTGRFEGRQKCQG